MVKRKQHIGMFLHNEMGVSWGGMSLMCGRSSIHPQKIFFLRSIDAHTCSIRYSSTTRGGSLRAMTGDEFLKERVDDQIAWRALARPPSRPDGASSMCAWHEAKKRR